MALCEIRWIQNYKKTKLKLQITNLPRRQAGNIQ